MASYVSHRRRWYRSLTTLDKTFSIPEHLQLEMMMDCTGITDQQQQLARLAATKPLTLERMSLALVSASTFEPFPTCAFISITSILVTY